jgi:hypothetical protein
VTPNKIPKIAAQKYSGCPTYSALLYVVDLSGLARPKTLIPIDFGTKSTYEQTHMVNINSSYVKIL